MIKEIIKDGLFEIHFQPIVSIRAKRLYAFEALTVLTEHLHKMAPEWEFISFTECENIASIELLKKLGYKNLGYVPSLDSQAFGKWTTMETEEEFAHLGK